MTADAILELEREIKLGIFTQARSGICPCKIK